MRIIYTYLYRDVCTYSYRDVCTYTLYMIYQYRSTQLSAMHANMYMYAYTYANHIYMDI